MIRVSPQLPINVPDGASGPWKVSTFKVTRDDVMLENLRALRNGFPEMVCFPGTYKRLSHDTRGCVMSNTNMEVLTCLPFIQRASGHVLINGLGAGMIVNAVVKKKQVETVVVTEIDEDVIRLVGPHVQHKKVTIVHGDAFKVTISGGFDVIWHDIWDDIDPANLKQMQQLRTMYKKHCHWQGCWAETLCKRIARNDR